jgi:steroid 5-alpha reductase family enzyme
VSKEVNDETEKSFHVTKVRYFINAHKIFTPFVVIGLMFYYDFWGVLAWVYLALHGTYCLLWMIKESTFRDNRFEEAIHPVAGFIFVFCTLGAYWAAPFIIISTQLTASSWLIALSIFITTIGVFYHFVSDAHKHAVLKIKKGLITTGLFSRTRNPNYFGEMLIYTGFAILAQHWLPLLALAYWWAFFVRNMLQKDKSISRYPEFAEWKENTGLLFPKLFR